MTIAWLRHRGGGVLRRCRRGGRRLSALVTGRRAAGRRHEAVVVVGPGPAANLERMEQAAALYREMMGREPRAGEIGAWAVQFHDRDQTQALDALGDSLRGGLEYERLVGPVVAEIKTIYSRYYLREPTRHEVASHLGRFRAELPADDDVLSIIRAGSIRKRLGIRPLHLEMDVINQCNLRCVMCHFSLESVYKQKRVDLSIEDFTKIAEELFPLCKHVSLSFNTEPLLHRRLGEVLDIAGSYNVPGLYMITNAMLLKPAVVERLSRNKVSLCVSVDAAVKETYERIRAGGRFETLLANIRAIQGVRDQVGSTYPHLHLNFVLMRSNITELPDFVRLANDLQVKSVGGVHLVPFEGTDTRLESLEGHKELCNRMLDEARAIGKEYGINTYFPANFDLESTDRAPTRNDSLPALPVGVGEGENRVSRCQFPWHWVGVLPNGDVRPCGWWYGEQPMGNIRSQTFEEIWNSERYEELRSEHRDGRLRAACLTCPAAGLGSVNSPDAFRTKRHFLSKP
ncbi:Putative mycofactocin radical SAM maturase MftC [Paludisphaera borealis]|uniref:Mycofactocin radical SAM maturase MftC n=2 Tax=Paludisphaera borealis TaxID=1387353 RepID=A0A1U7CSP7_9BACT|nr:Putative mycofactocin radical SAM maturase MftC [Paludisphaera borealis]